MGWRNEDDRFRGDRRFEREEDMGGAYWSGASGRGGMVRGDREHQGFSNYAGGGARDSGHSFGQGGFGAGARERQMSSEEGWRAEEIDRGPYWGKGPKGYRRSDERIKDDVCDSIAQQGWIDASDVEVRVENGVVLLAGSVASRDDKRRLEHLADRIQGVEDVRNEIRVRREDHPRPTTGHNGNRNTRS
jgi:osmotically-inducible protein OsmY